MSKPCETLCAFYLELGSGGSLSADNVLHGQPGGEESPVGQAGQLASPRALRHGPNSFKDTKP
jgi:hypothetical protein